MVNTPVDTPQDHQFLQYMLQMYNIETDLSVQRTPVFRHSKHFSARDNNT